MSVANAGVSGGVPVAGLNTGVPLTLANDYAQILPSNAGPPGGPDTQGVLTISGAKLYPSGTFAFEKVITPADFAAANWTPMSGVIRRDTGQILAGNAITLAANQSLDFTLPSVQGFYAVRVRRTDSAGGTPVASGATFQAAVGAGDPSTLAALQGLNTVLLANAIGMSLLADEDLMDAAQSSF